MEMQVQEARERLVENLGYGRAKCRIQHRRAYDYDDKRGLFLYHEKPDHDEIVDERPSLEKRVALLSDEEVMNLITNAGRIFLHTQGYATSGIGSNGLNFIALSNDTLTETATSTTLSTEIATNGLSRAQGTVTLPTGSGNQTTVDKTFTATGSQSAQKAALFTASSAGTMNHVLSFTQRALITNDTLQITYTITLG
jgi:hypothetical protein